MEEENKNKTKEKIVFIIKKNIENDYIKKIFKIVKKVNLYNDYNNNIKNGYSHIKSMITTLNTSILDNSIKTLGITTSVHIANEIIKYGKYRHPYCIGGAIVGSLIVDNVFDISSKNDVVNYTNNMVSTIENNMSDNVKELIYNCVTKHIEKVLSKTHTYIETIKNIVFNVICENHEKIDYNKRLFYVEDINNKIIEIEFDLLTVNKIKNYIRFDRNNVIDGYDNKFINQKFDNEKMEKLKNVEHKNETVKLKKIKRINTDFLNKKIDNKIVDYKIKMDCNNMFGTLGIVASIALTIAI